MLRGSAPRIARLGRLVRTRWFVPVAGSVLALVAGVGILVATGAVPSGDSAPEQGTHELVYAATSPGSSVVVTYTKGGSQGDGQGAGASPWSAAVLVSGNIAFLTATSGGGVDDSVACSIVDKATGRTLASDSVEPGNGGTVTCYTGALDGAPAP